LSNDDGVEAAGLRTLAAKLSALGEVTVVAPDRERSAQSHAFTMDRPLRCEEIRPRWFAVDGTPADCVYLGVLKILPEKPKLVVSGINHGFNLGSDVFYSGTVAGAVEAALRDVPAMAVSLEFSRGMRHEPARFETAAEVAFDLAKVVLADGLPTGTLLNVNVPAREPLSGTRWTRLGRRVYRDQVDEREDLRGRRYYWIGGPSDGWGDVNDSDLHAVRDGYASVTPLDLDLTHHGYLEKLSARLREQA
jgi:5'-nucleotidase